MILKIKKYKNKLNVKDNVHDELIAWSNGSELYTKEISTMHFKHSF